MDDPPALYNGDGRAARGVPALGGRGALPGASAAPSEGLGLSTALLSGVVVGLEVAHVRVLSYATDPRLVYGAIAVALAAMGAASITVALRPGLARGDVRSRVVIASLATALGLVASSALFARIAPWFDASSAVAVLSRALPVLLVLSVPYYPAGLVVALGLTGAGDRLPRRYAASLVGSAVGSFALFPLMRSLGIEAELVLLAFVAAAAGLFVAFRARLSLALRATAALCTLAMAALVPFASSLVVLEPDARDLLAAATETYVRTHPGTPRSFRPLREHAGWDPVSRVEVYAFPGSFGRMNGDVPIRLVTQDGGAASILVAFGDHHDARVAWAERSVYGVGYLVAPHPARVLVVGTGGGVDVVTALHHGARRVTAVELNATMIETARDRYARFQRGLLSRPEVELVHADGRAFAEQAARAGRRWPFVQMSGADTYSAGTAGAFMFSESYLYTLEAFRRYLRLLEPGGVLALIRFGPEPLRTVTTVGTVLRERGVTRPDRHVVVLRQGICSAIVVSLRPLDRAAVARVLGGVVASARGPFVVLPMWDAMGFGFGEPLRIEHLPGMRGSGAFQRALAASASRDSAAMEAFVAGEPLDHTPSTDDRPFFFQFLKPAALARPDLLDEHASPELAFFASGLLGHLRLVVGFVVLAALLLLVPPLSAWVRRRAAAARAVEPAPSIGGARGLAAHGATALYYGAIGTGFMLVELVLVQRTVLYLGHPTVSVAATLAALLVGSGAGSLLAGGARATRRPAVAVGLAIASGAAWAVGLELSRAAAADLLFGLDLVPRALVLAALVAPLGVAMGVPFPAGSRVLIRSPSVRSAGLEAGADAGEPERASLLAWALGVNGFAGVLASLVAVPAAMLVGFRAVLGAAAACYALAAAVVALVTCSRCWARRSKP